MRDVGDGDADDGAAGVVGIVIGRGVHRIIVILGVRRIDGNERQGAPVLAAGKSCWFCRFRFGDGRGGEDVRDRVGMDGDQAHRALGAERAEPFGHACVRQAVAALPRRDLDRHQIAIARVSGAAGGDRKLAAERFLVDRRKSPAAARRRAENAEHALPTALDELDDAPVVADRIVLAGALLDPQ